MAKRVTLKDVAHRAGVSYQTVSKVLNRQAQVSGETEARIRTAVQALGYQPDYRARNLRTQRSGMFGYSWAPSPPDQANPILDQFLQSMMEAAERAGCHILPFPFRQPAQATSAYRELIQTGRVDGFVLSSVESDDPRVSFLGEQRFPFVAFGRSGSDRDIPYVDVDNEAGMRMVTEHLAQLGHRRIAVLAWPESSRVGRERLQGYRQGLRAAGLPWREELVVRTEGRVGPGEQATLQLLDRHGEGRPTAIAAFSDPIAIGAMRAARARGLAIGQDLAITGFDDAPMVQYLSPALTSVRQPIREVGQQVISMLVSLVTSNSLTERHVLIQPQLIVRESSGPPVANA